MLRLRQRSLETNDRIKNLFNYLRLDTDRLDYGLIFDRIFLGEEPTEKLWAGRVNIKEKQFKIIRTKSDILKTDISSIIILGKERTEGNKKKIEITFGVSWKQTAFFLLIATSLMLTARFYFPNFFNWGTLLTILGIQTGLILIELKKTADMFEEYLNYLSPTNKPFNVSNDKVST